ncbi:MAG: hypothetical protein ACRDGM_04070 [bacterium]
MEVYIVGSPTTPIESIWLSKKAAYFHRKALGADFTVTTWPITYGPDR